MKMTAAVLYEQGLPHPFTVSKPMRIRAGQPDATRSARGADPGRRRRPLSLRSVGHRGPASASCRPWSATRAPASWLSLARTCTTSTSATMSVCLCSCSSCGNCRYCSDASAASLHSLDGSRAPTAHCHRAGGISSATTAASSITTAGFRFMPQYATVDQSAVVAIDKRVPLEGGVAVRLRRHDRRWRRGEHREGFAGPKYRGCWSGRRRAAHAARPRALGRPLADHRRRRFAGKARARTDRRRDAYRARQCQRRRRARCAISPAAASTSRSRWRARCRLWYLSTRSPRAAGTTVSAGLPRPEAAIAYPSCEPWSSDERTIKGSYMGSCIALPRHPALRRSVHGRQAGRSTSCTPATSASRASTKALTSSPTAASSGKRCGRT